MGLPNSKFGKEIPNGELTEGSVPSTPILTPKVTRFQELDPRSPSLHIARTPLEVLSAAAEKLEPYEQETPKKTEHLIGIDPRSPTTDFKRTPIILNSPGGSLLRKLHNKNLDKARLANTQPHSPSNGKTSIPPKLLESSPAKSQPDAYKRRSLIGLLETNIDYTETDLDSVLQNKCSVEDNDEKATLDVVDESETNKNYTVSDQVTDLNLVLKETHKLEVDEQKKDLNEVNGVENDVSNNEYCLKNNLCVKTSDKSLKAQLDIESEISKNCSESEDEVIKEQINVQNDQQCKNEKEDLSKCATNPTSPADVTTCTKEIKSEPVTPSFVNLTADIKELDKKLTNLIYEDDLVVCPRIVQLRENTDRSPLKNRNGNEFVVKNAQKLKVSDKPRRSDYVVSKIPVFKEKKSKLRNQVVQCENTPPRNIDKKKCIARKSDWDNKDTTLYL